MKLFYIECENEKEEKGLQELISNSFLRELIQGVYMINPKLNKDAEKNVTSKLSTYNNYSFYDNILHFLNNNSCNETMRIKSMYDIDFKVEISEVLEQIISNGISVFNEFDNDIYYSRNPWREIWEYLSDVGRELLKNRLDDLMKNLKRAEFNYHKED